MNNQVMANAAMAFMDSMTPKFAVSYLRVSTRGQAERGGGHDEGFSIPAQREANKNKAKTLGAIVGKELTEGHLPNPQTALSFRQCSNI